MTINLFEEDVEYTVENKNMLFSWLQEIARLEGNEILDLNYILCSDEYLHKINKEYLNHDTYTDIITFDHSEFGKGIEGDIFISINRVQENAITFNVSVNQELHRVMAHGLLHLLGYKDKTESQQGEMRKKEDACLSLLSEIK